MRQRAFAFLVTLAACSAACRDDAPPGSTGKVGVGGGGADTGEGGAGAGIAEGGAGGAGEGGAGGGASTGSAGGTPGGGWARPGCGVSPPPTVTGSAGGGLVLRGTVVTPDEAFEGEVLVVGDSIACAAPSCSGSSGYSGARVVETEGVIFPGLVDAHNHVLFNIFDEDDWVPLKSYENHHQWPDEDKYGDLVDAKQYLNGESGSPISLGCEMNKYGELKGLVGGTTSMVGSANPANKKCYGSLARTVDQGSNDLGEDRVQAGTLFPTKTSADAVCDNLNEGSTKAYVIHVGEGIDEKSRAEFYALGSVTTEPECFYRPETTIVHGTAFTQEEFKKMADEGMGLVWSPRSNVFLYGAGTDLSQTTDIPQALELGIRVSLAPDWALGGSQNMLDELRFADAVDEAVFGGVLSPETLVKMVTIEAARLIGWGDTLGSLEPGKKADVLVVEGDRSRPYEALLRARAENVRLVLVGGVALYGDPALASLGPEAPGCETIDVCCAKKFLCVAEAEGEADKLTQTFADIKGALESALASYDALDLSPHDFAPISPLVRCE